METGSWKDQSNSSKSQNSQSNGLDSHFDRYFASPDPSHRWFQASKQKINDSLIEKKKQPLQKVAASLV